MSEETHFGFARVPLQEKQARVDAVFHKVAGRYDLMNDLMSAGLHRVWKDIFTSRVHPARSGKFRHLDVAGGTGDIAFRIAAAGSAQTEIAILDINADMLEVGRERARRRAASGAARFRAGQRRGAAVRGQCLRCLHNRFRHPQRAADRCGARRGAPRAEARRPVPVPRILHRRRARCSTGSTRAIRSTPFRALANG